MGVMTINAIAEEIPTPVMWGSNYIVLGHALTDDSLNPHDSFGNYTLRVMDFTADCLPIFKPRYGLNFHSIKVVGYSPSFNHRNGSNQYGLVKNDIIVSGGSIITKTELDQGIVQFKSPISLGTPILALGYFEFLISDDGINYSPDTLSRFDVFVTFKLDHVGIDFNLSNTVDAAMGTITTVTTTMLPLAYDYIYHGQIPDYNFNDVDESNYVDMQGRIYPYKVEIRNIIGENCLKYFGEKLQIGQKIPINGIRMGNLKIDGTMLTEGNNPSIEIAFGDSFTGAFKINPI
ncbi:hypothetical protein [Flavobacterium sp. JP2137]|uniref:hypothetical protein n=1 Tax=Flavobacterium sp. JP2137 TaxID=3414510 RepID=UPI003D2FC68A